MEQTFYIYPIFTLVLLLVLHDLAEEQAEREIRKEAIKARASNFFNFIVLGKRKFTPIYFGMRCMALKKRSGMSPFVAIW